MYSDPPGEDKSHQLSSDLFWWREGKLQSLRAGVNQLGLQGCVIAPPQEFVDTVLVEAMRLAVIQPSDEPLLADGTTAVAAHRGQ